MLDLIDFVEIDQADPLLLYAAWAFIGVRTACPKGVLLRRLSSFVRLLPLPANDKANSYLLSVMTPQFSFDKVTEKKRNDRCPSPHSSLRLHVLCAYQSSLRSQNVLPASQQTCSSLPRGNVRPLPPRLARRAYVRKGISH